MFIILIVRQQRYPKVHPMLVSKKLKSIEEKPRLKTSQNQQKKVKKVKNSSPSKLKATPQKKKVKKDENVHINRSSMHSQQQSQLYKSKQSQKQSTIHKKSQNRDTKSKLLTTSPIVIPKSKSKSRSKSKSVSKLNTYRSTQDKDCKSVTKRLFTKSKENESKSRQKDKSKSRSRLKTVRDISPLKQIKKLKKFDVADRQIRYNKTQSNELKKVVKKKTQNYRSKQEAFLYPSEPINKQEPIQQPKVKLKKRVPQIKTQFSQRRGSFFDENLLKKLEINHQQGKKAQFCPFIHIKSNFQQRLNQQFSFHSKSHESQQSSCQMQQVQKFKRDQQLKWNFMLAELKSLKNEPIASEKIDLLIQNLNRNYTSLRQKAQELSSRGLRSNSSNRSHQKIEQFSKKQHLIKEQSLNQILLKHQEEKDVPINTQKPNFLKLKNELSIQNQKSNLSSLKFLSPIISFQNNLKTVPQEISNNKKQALQVQKGQQMQQGEVGFKRSNNINLSQFYNYMQKRQDKRKMDFQPFMKISHEQMQHFSLDFIKNDVQSRISDKNILNELNILDNTSNFIQKPKQTEFMMQMQKIRRSQQAVILNDAQYPHNFHNEIHINDEMSSQSMLLNASDNNNRKGQKIVQYIQQTLILQFCIQILRSKSILNNFITTYSGLVENNAINMQMQMPNDPRSITESSDQFLRDHIQRIINHIEVNFKQNLLEQIKIPFQCKPIQILKYIRTSQEDYIENSSYSQKSDEVILQVPYFTSQMVQQFELQVLKNQYFIPGYFSFNHCIYDQFNDIIDELRPYGNKGKAVFSLELSHALTNFEQIKKQITDRVNKNLTKNYEFQKLADQKHPNEEGIFELVYFTSADIVQMIFEQEVFEIARTFSYSNLKKYGN